MKHFFTLGYMPQYLPYGIVIGLICAVYAFFRTKGLIRSLGKDPKSGKSLALRGVLAALNIPFCLNIWAPACAVAFYIMLSGVIADLLAFIAHKLFKMKEGSKFYLRGGLTAVMFIAFLLHGLYGISTVKRTDYSVSSPNVSKDYRIVFISDTHYGTVQSKSVLKDHIEEINALSPDAVVLGGDIVDERTSKADMYEVFAELGKLKATYGVYFVYGNHDRQAFTGDLKNGERTFTDIELENAITDNGIAILCENYAVIGGEIVLVGREDNGWDGEHGRAKAEDLIAGMPEQMMKVMLDHQPVEAEENAALGFELQLSGHTHGGQLFPFGVMQTAMGWKNYGEFKVGGLTHITSSGFGGWGWPVRNEYPCEYVVVTVSPAALYY